MNARDFYGGADVVRPYRKRTVPGCSDTTLQDLWRKVVRAEWHGRCAMAGHVHDKWLNQESLCGGELQCHHIIKRRRPHLKHVPANGILLCGTHHALVEGFRSWRDACEDILGADRMDWLKTQDRMLFPDFLRERGMTRKEWLVWTKKYLSELVKGTVT